MFQLRAKLSNLKLKCLCRDRNLNIILVFHTLGEIISNWPGNTLFLIEERKVVSGTCRHWIVPLIIKVTLLDLQIEVPIEL